MVTLLHKSVLALVTTLYMSGTVAHMLVIISILLHVEWKPKPGLNLILRLHTFICSFRRYQLSGNRTLDLRPSAQFVRYGNFLFRSSYFSIRS